MGGLTTKVYVICDGTFCKIGVASDVRRRLEQLQIGNPNKLVIIFKKDLLSSLDTHSWEMRVKKRFMGKKKSGEWFHLSVGDVCKIILYTLNFGDENKRNNWEI